MVKVIGTMMEIKEREMPDTWENDGKVYTLPEDKKHSSLHLIIYAKGWYKGHFSTWDDIKDQDEHYLNNLKTIIEHWSGCPAECLSTRDVFHHVCCLWEDYGLGANQATTVESLLTETFFLPFLGKETIGPIDIIKRMMGQLSILSIPHFPKLPKPDSNILPLTVYQQDEAPFENDNVYMNDLFKYDSLVFDVINQGEYLGKYVTNEEVNCFWLAYKYEDQYYIRLKETGSMWEVTEADVAKFIKEKDLV